MSNQFVAETEMPEVKEPKKRELVRDILLEAVDRIRKEHGLAVTNVSVDYIKHTDYGREFPMMFVENIEIAAVAAD